MPVIAAEEALHHWDNIKSIKVYIPPKHEYTSLMKKAFNEWEGASKGKIKFLYVASPKQAQDIVVFNDMFSGSELGTTATKQQIICDPVYKRVNGKVQEICDEKNTVKVTVKIITIASKNPNSYSKMNNQDIYFVMLHEIGHSLGLPHSDNPQDLMYFQKNKGGARGITDNDVKALYQVYGWKYR
ncbi:matrixin family metalloprotease [bacterium]|nr:matrixin family metalloprotease [bacterium]